MTSGDKGEAPEPINRTRPPSFSLILLKTNLSHMGDGFLPEKIKRNQHNYMSEKNNCASNRSHIGRKQL